MKKAPFSYFLPHLASPPPHPNFLDWLSYRGKKGKSEQIFRWLSKWFQISGLSEEG